MCDDTSSETFVPSTLDELEQVHKKERKDLQAKVQGLKKSCAKGDKKKKKEVAEEIARLEADLDSRHEEEVKNFQTKSPTAAVEEVAEAVEGLLLEKEQRVEPRVTKAQKRRDKKAEKDKEREALIAQQEVENKLGPRHREEVRIKEILTSRQLQLYEVPSNGNCLYLAIEHQLKERGQPEKASVEQLRKLTADYLRSHEDNFRPFTCNPLTGCEFNPEEYQVYCDRVEKNSSEWGGQLELQALAEGLTCKIEVLQAEGAPVVLGEHFTSAPTLTLTYHRHAFGLGEHYNSVSKVTSS